MTSMPFVSEQSGLLHAHKLEYNLVDHCNLACRECSHLSPYLSKHALPLEVFVRDLDQLASVYRVKRFRFVGGEPLLNSSVLEFIHAVRASRIAPVIEIATNGILLQRATDQLFEAVDSFALSLYPGVACGREHLRSIEERCRRYGTKLKVEHIDRFRRMQVREATADKELVRGVFDSCLIAHTWGCQTFYDGYFYLCSRPIYTDLFIAKLGVPSEELRQRDGIPLHAPGLRQRLRTYLDSKEPLRSCRYCLGTVGRYEPHRQLSAEQRRVPVHQPMPADNGIDVVRLRCLALWHQVRDSLLRVVPSARLARWLAALETVAVGD